MKLYEKIKQVLEGTEDSIFFHSSGSTGRTRRFFGST